LQRFGIISLLVNVAVGRRSVFAPISDRMIRSYCFNSSMVNGNSSIARWLGRKVNSYPPFSMAAFKYFSPVS